MTQLNLSEEFNESRNDVELQANFNKKLRLLNSRASVEEIVINITSDNINHAKAFKALIDNTNFLKLQFDLKLRVTKEEYEKELNVFASGIKREQI